MEPLIVPNAQGDLSHNGQDIQYGILVGDGEGNSIPQIALLIPDLYLAKQRYREGEADVGVEGTGVDVGAELCLGGEAGQR